MAARRDPPPTASTPNIKGVPQTVAVGESIKYLAEEKTSDPKVLGIVANGYPHPRPVGAEAER